MCAPEDADGPANTYANEHIPKQIRKGESLHDATEDMDSTTDRKTDHSPATDEDAEAGLSRRVRITTYGLIFRGGRLVGIRLHSSTLPPARRGGKMKLI